MISAEEAALLCGVRTRTIYRWGETGMIHLLTQMGLVNVCLNSLVI